MEVRDICVPDPGKSSWFYPPAAVMNLDGRIPDSPIKTRIANVVFGYLPSPFRLTAAKLHSLKAG